MYKKIASFVLVLFLIFSCFTGCGQKEEGAAWDAEALAAKDAYLKKVDENFAHKIALELTNNKDFRSSSLGTRTAGSDAEHNAANYLYEQMKSIGLTNVEKVPVEVDKWQFNDATLSIDGIDKVIKPHSYATAATPKEGIKSQIVYAGNGTMQDYKNLDVKGKIVLVDIDQRANWWITYPMLQAEFQGAAAILSANVGGFAQVNEDALNSQDICGPTAIPCVSISVKDSKLIRDKLKNGTVTANLKVDNIVEPGGTSYNIVGKIPGKGESKQMIAVGGHYDMYFNGFQDDNCAVGLTLAMAKAMIDSKYKPDNDIVFILHGAEEWGSSYTQFDWTVGAWNMINKAHPEWVGNILTFINFELPAYEFADYTSVYSAPELYSRISKFVNDSPFNVAPENCFPKGVKTKGYQTYTYSDDFSYYIAGVPSTVNGFLLKEDMETPFDFYIDRYHSQFDDPSTYDKDVMAFNTKFYGSFAIYTDKSPALELNFTSQYDRLKKALSEKTATAAGADVKAYNEALEGLKVAAQKHYQKCVDLNDEYASAKNLDATEEELAAIRKEAVSLNQESLAIFKEFQNQLLGVMYEKPIVPHQAPQENIKLINKTIKALKEGDVVAAVDKYAWQINNNLEWYNMYFSPEVIAIQNDMFYGKNNQDNLFWGTNKMFTSAKVEEATRILMANYEVKNADMSKAISIYEKAISDQQALLKDLLNKETQSIINLTKKLDTEK